MPTSVESYRDVRFSEGLACPRADCQSRKVVRFGRQRNGLQRYRCSACRRTFSDRTGTPMARTRKPDKWEAFAECMQEADSCQKTASKLHINIKTAFYWRHKALASLNQTPQPKLGGIVEADEDSFARSYKGSTPVGRAARKRGGRSKNGRPRGQGAEPTCLWLARSQLRQCRRFRGPLRSSNDEVEERPL